MSRSIFFDNQPLIYIVSGFIAYIVGGWLVFSNIKTDEVVLQITSGNDQSPLFVEKRVTLKDSILVDASDRSKGILFQDKWFINRHPFFSKWGVFISLLIAFAGAIFLPAILLIIKMIKDYSLVEYIRQKNWLWTIPVFLLLWVAGYLVEGTANELVFLPTDILRHFDLLYENWWQREVFTNFIKAAAFTCLSGIVVLIFSTSWRNEKAGDDDLEEARLQKDLTKYFNFFAGSASILIAGGVLTSVLLRDVVFSLVQPSDDFTRNSDAYQQLVPASFHIMYGLNFTIILAIFLIPTRRYLNNSGRLALARIHYKDPDAGSELEATLNHNNLILGQVRFTAIILLPFIMLFAHRFLALLELI